MHLRGYYSDWGDFVNRVAKLERYVSDRPGNTAARFLLGYAYFFWDRDEDAASVFRGLLAEEPQDNGARYFLGLVEESGEKQARSSS